MKKILPLLLVLCGCKSIDVPKTVAALAKDNAHVHVEVRSVYGTIIFDREMPQGVGTNVITTSTAVMRH